MLFKNFNFLIKKEERKYFFIIFITILVGSFLETLSIAIFLPLFNLIFDNTLRDNYWMEIFNNSFKSVNENIILLLAVIISIFIFKNLLNLLLIYVKMKIINFYKQQKKKTLLNAYIDQDYGRFSSRDNSIFFRNIYHEIENYTENFILPIIELFFVSFILIGVSVFLFIYDFNTTIIVFSSLIIIIFIFYFFTKKRLLIFGEERAILQKKIFKKLPNIFNGFFEIKLFNLKNSTSNDFMRYIRRLDKIKIPQTIIGQLPRSFLEVFVVIGFSIFLIVQVQSGYEILPQIAKLSIYVVVILKLFPYLNGLTNIYTRIMKGFASYEILVKEFSNYVEISKSKQVDFREEISSIKIKDVSHVFYDKDKNEQIIFDNLNLKIEKNDFIGIAGKSGEGKTTLLKIISGILKPTSGEVLLNDKKIDFYSKESLYKNISYIPQEPFFIYDDVLKNIISNTNSEKADLNKVKKILSEVKLEKFIKNNEILNQSIGENGYFLSGGEKQRLALARAFYKNSNFIILDEVTNKLDSQTSKEIMDLINNFKGRKTIIIVSHNLNNLTHTDYILSLENHKIIKK